MFLLKYIFFSTPWWIESSKEQYLSNIIMSLMSLLINLMYPCVFKKILLTAVLYYRETDWVMILYIYIYMIFVGFLRQQMSVSAAVAVRVCKGRATFSSRYTSHTFQMSAVSQIACHKYPHECLTDNKCFCLLSEGRSGVRVILTDIMSSRSTCWFKYRKCSGLNYRLLQTAGGIIERDTRKVCVCVCLLRNEITTTQFNTHTWLVRHFIAMQASACCIAVHLANKLWIDLTLRNKKWNNNYFLYNEVYAKKPFREKICFYIGHSNTNLVKTSYTV